MTTTHFDVGAQTAPAIVPPARRLPLRLYLLRRSTWLMFTSLVGAVLFSVWISTVSLAVFAFAALVTLPVAGLVRRYADAHRHEARRLTGWRMERRYRSLAEHSSLRRAWLAATDPQVWRDAIWCLVHSVVACFTATLTVGLFLGGLFYLSYPFLYWVTPHDVFGRPFGGLFVLHSTAQAAGMMPFALVCFGLWYAAVLPLARTELHLTRALLSPRSARTEPE